MNQQQQIEQNVRMTLGDMHLQLIVANARIAELEAQIAAAELDKSEPEPEKLKANGKDKNPEARQ